MHDTACLKSRQNMLRAVWRDMWQMLETSVLKEQRAAQLDGTRQAAEQNSEKSTQNTERA